MQKRKITLLALIALIGWLTACRPPQPTLPPPITNTGLPVESRPDPPTVTGIATPGPNPAETGTPTLSDGPLGDSTLTAPATASPTPAITSTRRPNPTLGSTTPNPFATPATEIPPAVKPLNLDGDFVNLLLLGRDTGRDVTNYRTDVIIVASINRTNNVVTLLSIPRDLYVYIPGWTMNRINTAAAYGDRSDYPDGGPALLGQTILYNLGIPVHYWARVDFGGFKSVVDTLGGVKVPVTCALQDWRLISPELDQQNSDNWEQFYLDSGLQAMDGDLALWYSRTRRSTNDFDRSRRQHTVLRAMLAKALSADSLAHIPALYDQYLEYVDTDIGLTDVLAFASIAANLDNFDIKSRFIGPTHVHGWRTPEGAAVLLPRPDAIQALLAEAFTPPRSATLRDAPPLVEVWNGTAIADLDVLAADNLAWDGFAPVINDSALRNVTTTVIYDYTTSPKGSFIDELQTLFNLSDERIIARPDPDASILYRVVLGSDYNPCLYSVSFAPPAPTGTPGAAPDPGDLPTIAYRVDDTPVIDGELFEWGELTYTVEEPVFGPEAWGGLRDGSMVWAAGWDDKYLYLAVSVRDDIISQVSSGPDIFQGDSLELLLDMDVFSDLNSTELNEDDYQLGFSPGDLLNPPSPHTAYLWHPQQDSGAADEVLISFKLTPEGYQGEIGVPWEMLHHTPYQSQEFGFVLSVIDNDTPNAPGLHSIIANTDKRDLTNPTTWLGRLHLGGLRQ